METPELPPVQPAAADPAPPAAGEAAPPAAKRVVTNAQEATLLRLFDYLAASLNKRDHLEANLGAINAGLMRVAYSLGGTIETALAVAPPTVEGIQPLLPAIDTHLRVTRQVDRFAQIELRSTPRPAKSKENQARDRLRGIPPAASEDFTF